MKKFVLLLTLILLCSSAIGLAAPIHNFPVRIVQPDGQQIDCFASGDEFYNWYHDAEGFTIVQSRTDGYYYYAVETNGTIVPSRYRPIVDNPAHAGLKPNAKCSNEFIRERVRSMAIPAKPLRPQRQSKYEEIQTANTGVLNNIVVFIRFAGEAEFTDSTAIFDRFFNSLNTTSLKSYYREVTYNRLEINSSFYPSTQTRFVVSYQDSNARSYYMPYSATNTNGYEEAQRAEREHGLLARCISAIEDSIPDSLVIDNDNDGYVDNVCFVVSGTTTAWSTLLWPHRWALYSVNSTINGKRVWDFNFQIHDHLLASSYQVLAHEMFHSLGAPDLYRYENSSISPLGPWDLMEWGNGHMCAYMKYKYGGWIDSIPTITTSGTYTVNALSSPTNNCYRIMSTNSDKESFIVEYRKAAGALESTLPGSGLVIYRVNPSLNGNSAGPPDEVYVFRPNGTPNVNGNVYGAFFSTQVQRTQFNSTTNPSSFLADSSPAGIRISQIGASGADAISFYVSCPSVAAPALVSPAAGAIVLLTPPALSWAASAGATSYRVQLSTDSTFANYDVTTITTGTNYQTVSLSYDQHYFWRVRAFSATDSSYWSAPRMFNYRESLYCTVGSSCDEYIRRVTVGTINNQSECSQTGYMNYSNLSTSIRAGGACPITIVNGLGYSYDECGVWVDWNEDGDFSGPNEAITLTNNLGVGPYTGIISVPSGTNTGAKRLRIRITYNTTPLPCGNSSYGETEDYTLNVVNPAPEGISIVLKKGWNMVSCGIVPSQNSMATVVQSILPNLVVVADKDQAEFFPNGSGSLSTWAVGKAYHILLTEADTLAISGTAANPTAYTIALTSGWNFIPYIPKTEMSVQNALASVWANVVAIKDNDQFFIPALMLNSLGTMKPGKAYYLYVNQGCNLVYPAPTNGNRITFPTAPTSGNQSTKELLRPLPSRMTE